MKFIVNWHVLIDVGCMSHQFLNSDECILAECRSNEISGQKLEIAHPDETGQKTHASLTHLI